jgi:hypothetical protein
MTLASDAMSTPAMKPIERLTWDEIRQRYPDEWIVMAEVDWVNDTDFEFGTAIVLGHHKTRKDVSPSVKEAMKHYEDVCAFFTGRLVPPPYEIVSP